MKYNSKSKVNMVLVENDFQFSFDVRILSNDHVCAENIGPGRLLQRTELQTKLRPVHYKKVYRVRREMEESNERGALFCPW